MKYSNYFFILVRYIDNPKNYDKILGGKCPQLEEQQLRIAAHWLNDDYEGQRWPTLQEVYQLLILTLNRKYVIRRKLCGFRPLLRSEFFTSGEYSLEFFFGFFLHFWVFFIR